MADNNRREAEGPAEQSRPRGRKRMKTIPELILQDLVMMAVILLVFALIHHVIPRAMTRMGAAEEETVAPKQIIRKTSPPPSQQPEPTGDAASTEAPGLLPLPEETVEAPSQGGEPAGTPAVPTPSPEPTPEPTPDPMDWRTKFADHFTEEVVITDHSYSSPDIAIDIQRFVSDDPAPSTYFVADIYVAQVENFQTRWAGGSFRPWMYEEPITCARNAGAILAVNGDYADSQDFGFLVRNGELYMEEQTMWDICVLYYDGVMETYGADEYVVDDILDREPWQVWKFGPALLDENGQPRSSFNTTGPVKDVNPRTGVGYYEPGHYCFVVVDGRQGSYSAGMRIERFAQLFADLGCRAAYNLDGGQSSVMVFQERFFNNPYLGGRDAGDILLIREIDGEG